MDMNIIASVDQNWGLGIDGGLLLRVPADMKRFKELTWGHVLILGRRTLATFPEGRPLPGRDHLLLSRDPDFSCPGARVFSSVERLLAAAGRDYGERKLWVVGGASVYRQLLPYCREAWLTRWQGVYPADCFLPDLDKAGWRVVEEGPVREDRGVRFRFARYAAARE